MSEDLHNIDDLFKKALENNTELPSENAWDNIEKSLDKKKVISISKKYKNLKWIAAVLLLFSLGMAMYTLHISNQNKELVRQNYDDKKLMPENNQSTIGSEDSFNTSIIIPDNKNVTSPLRPVKNNHDDSLHYSDDRVLINNDNDSVIKKSFNIKNSDTKRETVLSTAENDKNENTISENLLTIIHNTSRDSLQTHTWKELTDVSKDIADNTKLENTVNKKQKSSNITTTHKRLFAITSAPEIETANDKATSIVETEKNIAILTVLPDLKSYSNIPENSQSITINNSSLLKTKVKNYKKSTANNKLRSNKISKSPFSLIAFYSPDIISDKEADDDDHPRFMEEERNEIKKDEKIKLSSTTGLLVSYNLNSKWQVQSGITFSSRKTDIRPKTIYARPDNNGNVNYRLNCSAGYSYINLNSIPMPASGDSLMALSSKNTLNYVGVPIALRYVLTTSKWNLIPEVGTSFNFLTKGNITTTTQQPQTADKNITSAKIQGLKSSYVDGLVGFAAQYNFSKLLAVSFQPTLRFALSSINNDAPIKTNLNSVGFIAGLVIKL